MKKTIYTILNQAFPGRVSHNYPQTFNDLPYITFFESSQAPIYADDSVYTTERHIIVEIFSREASELPKISEEIDNLLHPHDLTNLTRTNRFDKQLRAYVCTTKYRIIGGENYE